MKSFLRIIMACAFNFVLCSISTAQNQLIESTHKDSTIIKNIEIRKYLNNRYCIGLLFGYSSLKVVPDWGAVDLISKLPRIDMYFNTLRFGKRTYLGRRLPTYFEAVFGFSKGTLRFDYSDPNAIIYQSDNPFKYISGESLHIIEDINVTNTIIGGSTSLTIPIYFLLNPRQFFLSPKGIFLNLTIGANVIIMKANNNELPYISYSKRLDEHTIETGVISGEIITVDDWVLFYIGLGFDYMLGKHFILKFDSIIGTYPVSGPGTTAGPTGLPDTWGGEKTILIGFEFLF